MSPNSRSKSSCSGLLEFSFAIKEFLNAGHSDQLDFELRHLWWRLTHELSNFLVYMRPARAHLRGRHQILKILPPRYEALQRSPVRSDPRFVFYQVRCSNRRVGSFRVI